MTDVPDELIMSTKDASVILYRLASLKGPDARRLYWRIASLWLGPQRTHVRLIPDDDERTILSRITLPAGVVQCQRYVAVYRCDTKPEMEVTVRTHQLPPKRKTLKIAGGKKRFTRIFTQDIIKENNMARKTASAKAKAKTAPAPDDDLEDELAELEELEDIEELEVEIDDEEDEDGDDDGEPELMSLTARQLKKLCADRGIRGVDKKNKTALVALLEAQGDDEDDEEDEDEEDEVDEGPDFDAMTRAELKAHLVEQDASFKAKKSQSDDDLRALCVGDDDDEDDDEEDAPPVKKGRGRPPGVKNGEGKKANTPPKPRELPAGKLSANDVAELAGTDARSVRMFLRSEKGQEFPKDEELNRYVFSKTAAAKLVKALNKRSVRADKK